MIVLDTHAWIWWRSDPAQLGRRARAALEAGGAPGVSAISAWEVATLVRRGRIALDRDVGLWTRQALGGAVELPVSASIATAAGRLGDEFPGDPADRLIFATAVAHGATLVTRDDRMTAFDAARVVW